MTPARLALMTAVGPPDCATSKFPRNSPIKWAEQCQPRTAVSNERNHGAPGPYGVFTLSNKVRFFFGEQRHSAMSIQETRDCLRDLQVVATVPHISEEQIVEL